MRILMHDNVAPSNFYKVSTQPNHQGSRPFVAAKRVRGTPITIVLDRKVDRLIDDESSLALPCVVQNFNVIGESGLW